MQKQTLLVFLLFFSSCLMFGQEVKQKQATAQQQTKKYVKEIMEGDRLIIIYTTRDNNYDYDIFEKNKIIISRQKKTGGFIGFKSKDEVIRAAKEELKQKFEKGSS